MPEPLSTASETAQVLGLSPDLVRRMLRRGELPEKRIGTCVLIPVEAVHALAAHI